MQQMNHHNARELSWAPGTIKLATVSGQSTGLILNPVPSSDPNDPLNWSYRRKFINFGLLCSFVLWTFVQLNVGFTAWEEMQAEIAITTDQLNIGYAINYGGIALGCYLFMPFVHKYGRRPLYLISSAIQLASVIWSAQMTTSDGLFGSTLLSGLGGAISESVAQITIADVFFVHQYGTMTGTYLMFVAVGAFLSPVASGYVVASQGWRWIWRWCIIFMGLNLILVLFCFEETKYARSSESSSPTNISSEPESNRGEGKTGAATMTGTIGIVETITASTTTDETRAVPPKTYRQRLALTTPSSGSLLRHFYQPIIVLFMFPAVSFAALTYGIVLTAFSVVTSVQASYLTQAPYHFGPAGIGLMNIPFFVGGIFGFVVGGIGCDRLIVWLAKRNGGIYEPEMRLWLALVATVILPAGTLIFGIGIAKGMHWGGLAVSLGFFGFAFVLTGDISIAYVTDCYQHIVGDALVGITCVRNLLPLIVLFFLTPWNTAMGLQSVFIITAAFCFVILCLPIALLIWGKGIRRATAERYRQLASG